MKSPQLLVSTLVKSNCYRVLLFCSTTPFRSGRYSAGFSSVRILKNTMDQQYYCPDEPLNRSSNSSSSSSTSTSTSTNCSEANPTTAKSNRNTSTICDVEELHRIAIQRGEFTYEDPMTGFTVFTELAHRKRGKCCGNMCRHCPFGWVNVPGLHSSSSSSVKQLAHQTNQLQAWFDDDDRKKTEESNIGKGGKFGGTLTKKNVPYTRTGDKGTAALFTGERRMKNDIIFEAMGTVDELCSFVGRAHAEMVAIIQANKRGNETDSLSYGSLQDWLLEVMSRLFDVGSIIAKPTAKPPKAEENDDDEEASAADTKGVAIRFDREHVENLERWIDLMTEELPELQSFILPTGGRTAADLHICRTVCRRAERLVVGLEDLYEPEVVKYLNRLSDFFFTAARFTNEVERRDEISYQSHVPGSMQRYRVVTSKRST